MTLHPEFPLLESLTDIMASLGSTLRTHWPLAAALAILALLQFGACIIDLPRLIDNFTIDDTYLYLQVARNAGMGEGFTFDGIHRTNGFQPL